MTIAKLTLLVRRNKVLYYVRLQIQVTNMKHKNIYVLHIFMWCNLIYDSLKRQRFELSSSYRFQV